MSTERPEFQPIDTAPARRTWPWAVVGAALVVALLWFARRVPAPIDARPAALASVPVLCLAANESLINLNYTSERLVE